MARVSACAGAGDIVVTDAVRSRLGEAASFESIGRAELKGVSRPVELFRMIRDGN